MVAKIEQNRRRSWATSRILPLRSGQSRPKAGCERKGFIYGQAPNPFFSLEAEWAALLPREDVPHITLRLVIGYIALTRRAISVKDHLLPQYTESVLLGNRYFRRSNHTLSILDRLTFQADHVVV